VFSAFAVKVVPAEKSLMINFEWNMKPRLSRNMSAPSLSPLISALLDASMSDCPHSAPVVKRKLLVGSRVLDYLKSHSAVLATICGLVSCRKSHPKPGTNASLEGRSENSTVYHRTGRKTVKYNGCTFVREFEFPSCEQTGGSANEGRPPGTRGGVAAAGIDENLRDDIFRKLKHQLPTLKRFYVQFLSPLLPGADDPKSDPFWLLCSSEIPDELCPVMPSLLTDGCFTSHVYRHISQLIHAHSLRSCGFGKLTTEPESNSFEEILRLFGVVPSSLVRNSILWSALQDFVIISAVQGGTLSSAYALRVRDTGARCRLLMSMTVQVDPSDRSLFVNMLKSCFNDSECSELKQVARKCIVTSKLHSEVIHQLMFDNC